MKQVERWQEIQRDQRSITFKYANKQLRIVCCSPHIVRVQISVGEPLPRRSWAVYRDDPDWDVTAWETTSVQHLVRITTAMFQLTLDTKRGTVACSTLANEIFCEDVASASVSRSGATLRKRIDPNDHFYGFGERTGWLEKSNQSYPNWTFDPEHTHTARVDTMYAALPIYLVVRPTCAYGVFFNTTFYSSFDIGAIDPEQMVWSTDGPDLDYFIVFGPTPAKVVAGFGQLLGTMPLPPRWALGYHQSRWSYESEPVVRDLAAQFRGRAIPCDAIHLDIDYMRGYRVFTWDDQRFPDPLTLISDLAADGLQTVVIIDPGVKTDPDYAVFQAGVQRDIFIRRADGSLFSGYVWPDDSAFADFTRPAVREWWGELHRALVEAGVRGIWDDMNEPTVFARPFSEGGGQPGTIDLDAPQGDADERTLHAEVHNVYGLLMARATYEGLLALRPNERPFVLTRSGYAGLQRWATLWSGDNSALWEHLEMTLPQLCNIGLSGVPFCGVDIGGFFGNASAELWARWVQLGAFLPFCRGHSCAGTRQAEPWVFGERTEAIARAYLTLRYRLLPYIYTLFHEAATTGAPLLRPLVYEFPEDATTYRLHDQAMLGPGLLLAPIVRPGVEHRAVYLPAGEWYDWWTGERISGPIHLLAHAPLERMPLYIRGGSILPLGPAMQHTSERPLDHLTLDIYPAGSSEWTLYEDDGISFDYQAGAWATTTFRCSEQPDRVVVEIDARTGDWQPHERTLLFNIHGPQPRSVLLDDQPLDDWVYDDGSVAISFDDDAQAHRIIMNE